jgi:hypothetical protein
VTPGVTVMSREFVVQRTQLLWNELSRLHFSTLLRHGLTSSTR